MEYVNIAVSILSGILVCIPLVIKLYQAIKDAIQEKNWNQIVLMVFDYMKQAEALFTTGAERKEWVMSMIMVGAQTVNFNLDDAAVAKISQMIDDACALAKLINNK